MILYIRCRDVPVMRKLIVEVKLNDRIREAFSFFLEKLESLELLELIKIDFKEGTKLAIAAVTVKDGYAIDTIWNNEFIEMLTVLSQDKNRYVCLIKTRGMEKISTMLSLDHKKLEKEYSFDLVWSPPTVFSHDKIICSVIGTEENLKRFLHSITFAGDIKHVSYSKATYTEDSFLSCLTKKQREVLIAANKYGYYAYPRKITSEQLAKKVGLSKPTVLQHLRKAEVRLIANLLTGY
jgi:DNA-binding CsgD family transcriptional regulator